MICVRLMGGLGNQLFQYATGRALALQHDTELLLDLSFYSRQPEKITQRSFALDWFTVRASLASSRQESQLAWARRLAFLPFAVHGWHVQKEHGLSYDPAFPSMPDQSYLLGYWQSYRYFQRYAAELATEIRPINPLSEKSDEMAKQIEACSSVALHVRRGDYVTLVSAAAYHGVLPLNYYTRAIEHMQENCSSAHFFVFSDDSDWCRQNIPLPEGRVTYVSHNGPAQAWEDLHLMRLCRHHVVANSSFSWWGAWLADCDRETGDRLVVAPDRWFADDQLNRLEDRLPPHWHVLSVISGQSGTA